MELNVSAKAGVGKLGRDYQQLTMISKVTSYLKKKLLNMEVVR